jgi:propanediol dehydratase small subunit
MNYPLYEKDRGQLRLSSDRPIDEFSVDNLLDGRLGPNDLGIREETLRQQAEIAKRAGFPQVACNLERAAELVRIPDGELLKIYEALRPGHCSTDELESLAQKVLDSYGASLTAEFIREAAASHGLRATSS